MLQAAILGITQGLTELWPISSSAHLYLLPYLAGWPDLGLTMTVFLHFGTLLAVVGYFFRDWVEIFKKRRQLLWLIILATIPASVVGYFLEGDAETAFRSPLIIALNLILFGLILGWADWSGKKREGLKELHWSQALLIGLSQALALVPGVSRSGITISIGLFLGLTRASAARFSFLLLGPILLGASLLRSFDLFNKGVAAVGGSWLAGLAGLLASFLFSYLALVFLFKIIKRGSFWPFVFYRIILALIVLSVTI